MVAISQPFSNATCAYCPAKATSAHSSIVLMRLWFGYGERAVLVGSRRAAGWHPRCLCRGRLRSEPDRDDQDDPRREKPTECPRNIGPRRDESPWAVGEDDFPSEGEAVEEGQVEYDHPRRIEIRRIAGHRRRPPGPAHRRQRRPHRGAGGHRHPLLFLRGPRSAGACRRRCARICRSWSSPAKRR